MFLSNTAGYFVICVLIAAGAVSCGLWQNKTPAGVKISETVTDPVPFSTKEPGTYRAEIVIIAGGTERRIFTAKKGLSSRIDYDAGTPHERTVLHNGAGFVLLTSKKIYAEQMPDKTEGTGSEVENDMSAGLLNRRYSSAFENLGNENGLNKYRTTTGEKSRSESIIFVNEELGLPVRQDFYSIDTAGGRTLQYSVEMREISFDVDDSLFAVPRGFQKVSMDEFTRRFRQ